MILFATLLMQFQIQNPLDNWTPDERRILVAAVTPYGLCINERVPDYLSLTRPDARTEQELSARVDRVVSAMEACRSHLTNATERIERDLPAHLANIPPNQRWRAIGLFLARFEDSYTYPVMLGAPPQLTVPFPSSGQNDAQDR